MKQRTPTLDQDVQVERLTQVPDGQGGFSESWAVVYTLQAQVTAKSGGERQHADRTEAASGYDVVIHAIDAPDLTELDRILWDGVRLNIRHAPPAQRSVWRFLDCDRGVAA